MTDLTWPGDERAGDMLSDGALLVALVQVESAWLDLLVDSGLAPADARADLTSLVSTDDVGAIAADAESTGTPVASLVGLLRDRCSDAAASTWLHRGLTSQDVLDTAVSLALRDALHHVRSELTRQVQTLADLAERHRDDPAVARTLTQHAVPTTLGVVVSGWLGGILDAAEQVDRLELAAQVGGAAGTRAAVVELAAAAGRDDPVAVADQVADDLASRLGLAAADPWHTTRARSTRIADVLVGCTDAWGRLADDVLVRARPEIGEMTEGGGRGGSSTMPHKRNPVLSVLLRRAALSAPALAATVHLAAATSVDQRSDGAWHAEWPALRTLGRRTLVAASQTTELLSGLRVDATRAARTLETAEGVRSEQAQVACLRDAPPRPSYLGVAGPLVDRAVRRAREWAEGRS